MEDRRGGRKKDGTPTQLHVRMRPNCGRPRVQLFYPPNQVFTSIPFPVFPFHYIKPVEEDTKRNTSTLKKPEANVMGGACFDYVRVEGTKNIGN